MEAEVLEEIEVFGREVVAVRLEEAIFFCRKRYVTKLCSKELADMSSVLNGARLTVDLVCQPSKRDSRQLLVWGTVGERVCDRHFSEALEDGALHRQLVQIGIQEGYDALREGRGAIEVHGHSGRWRGSR